MSAGSPPMTSVILGMPGFTSHLMSCAGIGAKFPSFPDLEISLLPLISRMWSNALLSHVGMSAGFEFDNFDVVLLEKEAECFAFCCKVLESSCTICTEKVRTAGKGKGSCIWQQGYCCKYCQCVCSIQIFEIYCAKWGFVAVVFPWNQADTSRIWSMKCAMFVTSLMWTTK